MTSGDNSCGIFGLVLAGGKSSRMGGNDKGMATWHGRPQRYYLAGLLKQYCTRVFISCREEQATEIENGYSILTDKYTNCGPTGGILTALEYAPQCSWLVVACDLPFVDEELLQYLVTERDSECIATTFESPFDHLPEPLITIWEPASYTILKAKLEEGYKCPRKILINNKVRILQPPHPEKLMNVNTPEDVINANKSGIFMK